jgi:hypothetical protein
MLWKLWATLLNKLDLCVSQIPVPPCSPACRNFKQQTMAQHGDKCVAAAEAADDAVSNAVERSSSALAAQHPTYWM